MIYSVDYKPFFTALEFDREVLERLEYYRRDDSIREAINRTISHYTPTDLNELYELEDELQPVIQDITSNPTDDLDKEQILKQAVYNHYNHLITVNIEEILYNHLVSYLLEELTIAKNEGDILEKEIDYNLLRDILKIDSANYAGEQIDDMPTFKEMRSKVDLYISQIKDGTFYDEV